MASSTKTLGTLGEQALIFEFIKHGIWVSKPIGDNVPYDFIVDANGRLLRVQVKTTEHVNDGIMVFETNKTNPHRNTNRKYSTEEIDLFGLYCVENGYVGLVPIKEYNSKQMKIRLIPTKNHQNEKVKYAHDFEFDSVIANI